MRILLDGMGGDYAPDAVVTGAVQAVGNLPAGTEILLIGQEKILKPVLEKTGYSGDKISIVNAEEIISNGESPVKAIRRKKDSSIVRGFRMLKEGEGDVFLSAGSTGALLAGSLLILGRIPGIERPTLAAVYPVIGAEPSLLVDTGANAECRPRNLLEFGIMGSVYMEQVMGRSHPTVGLVNNGTEPGKGTALTKEAYVLLENSDLNFIGNIEARELQNAVCDVIVTDGFTGNAIIKLSEGLGLMVLREMKKMFLQNAASKVSALLLKNQLKTLKSSFDYKEYGGAPILGVKGAVLKMHGSSDARAVEQTILKSVPYVENDVVGVIEKSVEAVLPKNTKKEPEESAD